LLATQVAVHGPVQSAVAVSGVSTDTGPADPAETIAVVFVVDAEEWPFAL
jgi:hypothetical protein